MSDDTDAFGQRRRGRKPKSNKRVPLSLLVDPEVRRRLVDAAQENGRSLTGETEVTLKRGFNVFISHSMDSETEKIAHNLCINTTVSASSIGERAGIFLVITYPGRSKDERIAHDLGISAGMAKLLRQGRAWTVGRLDQALELWPEFREFVFFEPRSMQIANQLEQLAAGLARLANEMAELRQELRNDRPHDQPSVDPATHETAVTESGACGGNKSCCDHDPLEKSWQRLQEVRRLLDTDSRPRPRVPPPNN
jgi:hypothetical protein